MHLVFYLFIFLPYLNRDGCDTPGIGYTCKDLDEGVKKLQQLLQRPRIFTSSFSTYSKVHCNQIIIRLRSLVLALSTNTTSLLSPYPIDFFTVDAEGEKIKLINFPSISKYATRLTSNTFYPPCFDVTNTTQNITFSEKMPITIDYLFLNPLFHRLTEYLGPAAFHILIHYSLNFSTYKLPNSDKEELFFKTQKNKDSFGILSPMPPNAQCVTNYFSNKSITPNKNNLIKTKRDPNLKKIIRLINADEFGFEIGDPVGFMISILRGYPSYIYDPVSRNCYKGRSIISGSFNPLYSSIHTAGSEFSILNYDFCGNPNITKKVLQQLL